MDDLTDWLAGWLADRPADAEWNLTLSLGSQWAAAGSAVWGFLTAGSGWAVSQSVSQSVSQPVSQSASQLVSQSACQSVSQSVSQSVRANPKLLCGCAGPCASRCGNGRQPQARSLRNHEGLDAIGGARGLPPRPSPLPRRNQECVKCAARCEVCEDTRAKLLGPDYCIMLRP